MRGTKVISPWRMGIPPSQVFPSQAEQGGFLFPREDFYFLGLEPINIYPNIGIHQEGMILIFGESLPPPDGQVFNLLSVDLLMKFDLTFRCNLTMLLTGVCDSFRFLPYQIIYFSRNSTPSIIIVMLFQHNQKTTCWCVCFRTIWQMLLLLLPFVLDKFLITYQLPNIVIDLGSILGNIFITISLFFPSGRFLVICDVSWVVP